MRDLIRLFCAGCSVQLLHVNDPPETATQRPHIKVVVNHPALSQPYKVVLEPNLRPDVMAVVIADYLARWIDHIEEHYPDSVRVPGRQYFEPEFPHGLPNNYATNLAALTDRLRGRSLRAFYPKGEHDPLVFPNIGVYDTPRGRLSSGELQQLVEAGLAGWLNREDIADRSTLKAGDVVVVPGWGKGRVLNNASTAGEVCHVRLE